MRPESDDVSAAGEWMRIARSELAAADGPYDREALPGVYCYLAQQSAEKALKALMVRRGIEPPRIHEIQTLLVALGEFPDAMAAATVLSKYAGLTRYPGDLPDATWHDLEHAVETARLVVEWVEHELGRTISRPPR